MKKRLLNGILILCFMLSVPVEVLAATSYPVYYRLPVYGDSGSALSRTNPLGTIEAGSYYLNQSKDGMDNISPSDGTSGHWINPASNRAVFGLWETTATVNFRTGPSSSYGRIEYLQAGTKVELVTKYSATWYAVRYQGRVGYVSASYLKALGEGIFGIPTVILKDIIVSPYVTTTSVNLRSGPSTAYSVIRKLEVGQTLYYLAPAANGWAKVSHGGKQGYLSSKYITPFVFQKPSSEYTTVLEGTRTYLLNAQMDVRTGPGTGFAKTDQLSAGTQVGVVSMNNSWAMVRYSVNSTLKTGYINTVFLSPQVVIQKSLPKIGIVYNPNNLFYSIEAINRAGGEAVLLPKAISPEHATQIADSVDGIVFAGGRVTGASDRYMIKEALAKDKPILGICLGFQTIVLGSGGTLNDLISTGDLRAKTHRDPLDKAFVFHDINIFPDSKLANLVGSGKDSILSSHRMIVNTLGANLKVTARSTDGVIEGVERTDKTFVVGVGFHPERMYVGGNAIYHNLFVELVHQARAQH